MSSGEKSKESRAAAEPDLPPSGLKKPEPEKTDTAPKAQGESDDKAQPGTSTDSSTGPLDAEKAGSPGGPGGLEGSGGSGAGSSKAGLLGRFVAELSKALPSLDSEGCEGSSPSEEGPPPVLAEPTLEAVAEFLRSGRCRNVVVMSGAGISTSAGIPDFRSPGTGLYDNLAKYDLPHPQAIFEIGFFKKNPRPFFTLAKELYPGNFRPTPSHFFVRLLAEKGLLLRSFTQNIDALEHVAGVPSELCVEAHGSFATSHCTKCKAAYDMAWVKERIFRDDVPECPKCQGVVKPDIVFFGENLPRKFFYHVKMDMPMADLLIIMGTSLVVHPFASLTGDVPDSCPRLLINDKKVGQRSGLERRMGMPGLDYDWQGNVRDVFEAAACDDAVRRLAELCGWEDDLQRLIDGADEEQQ